MRYITSALYNRVEHPILVSLFILAGVCVVVGIALDQTAATSGVVAGFFGVYAVILVALGLIGYGLIFAIRRISEYQERKAPHR